MLHERGKLHYEAHDCSTAIVLLTPAVFFSTNLTVGKSARLLAMSLIKAQQPHKALDYVGLAEQQEGHSTALGCLIRLHALLLLRKQHNTAHLACPAALGNGKSSTAAAAGVAGCDLAEHDSSCCAAALKLSKCADFGEEALQVRQQACTTHQQHAHSLQAVLAMRHLVW